MDLWISKSGERPERHAISKGIALTRSGNVAEERGNSSSAPAVVLLPTRSLAAAVGVILVAVSMDSRVSINGRPLYAGGHLLRDHANVCFGHCKLWVAKMRAGIPVTFDTRLHGTEVRCARTRRVFADGELVMMCPTPGCELLFSAEAWQAMIPCHACGFDPSRSDTWEPPNEQGEQHDAQQQFAG